MSFLGVSDLLRIQEESQVIAPFNSKRVKNGAYELSLGSEAFLTDSKDGKIQILKEDTNRQIDINPGQFALLLTAEKVNVPVDKIAFISIKAGEKLKGLVNVSGFHVDPGFHDNLVFSVYNAGPSTIVLNTGDPYFPIWFADLTSDSNANQGYGKSNEHFDKLSHIPSKYIEVLKRGELTSPKALFDRIMEVESDLTQKIVKSDEKIDRNEWLYKIIIGLVLTIFVKIIWDWAEYDRGYNDGRRSKLLSEEVVSKVNSRTVDSLLSSKLDSVLKTRMIYDTASKK
ncbi:dCTP deaminase domain-containing protein [Dyadobacter sp. OTU695]|uniref:dCTP deaminase domain-containing protein n=1 Tax=Dyadobacter sp. OTU695 TaxID=3043860 RepID=UPI00313E17F2